MTLNEPFVAFIDVGHGNCTVVKDKNEVVIIDCGDTGNALLEFLTRENIREIKKIYLSHADRDHIGGLLAVLASDEFIVDEVVANADASKQSLWKDLMLLLQHTRSRGTQLRVGLTTSEPTISCGSMEIQVASPSPYLALMGVGNTFQGKPISSNSQSASFHIYWKAKKIVYLAGDIDTVSLLDIVKEKISLQADILVYPHHGGWAGRNTLLTFTETLCDMVAPSTVLFSIGREQYSNPQPQIVRTIRSKIPDVRIGCTQLSKHCTVNTPVHTPVHLHPTYARGKRKHQCCGGTFVLQLKPKYKLFPVFADHLAFIQHNAPTPLCLSSTKLSGNPSPPV